MSVMHHQVRRARNRLWLDRWLDVSCRLLAAAAAVFAIIVLLTRLYGWEVPLVPVAAGLLALAAMASLFWSLAQRPDEATAAVALDEAAGLRERVSSGLYCESSDDPFAQAVRSDAEARASAITVRQHLRLRFPDSALFAGGAIILAALLLLLLPHGLLARADAKTGKQEQTRLAATRVEVKRRLQEVKKMAQTNKALADLEADFSKLDAMPTAKMNKPDQIRLEAIKKIDKLTDAVRRKRAGAKHDKLTETKRMLRALRDPVGEKTPVQKLSRQLAAGEFKGARETIKQMQEQLATLKQDSDKELVKKMQKQLEHLAKQLDQVSNQEQLKKKLEQAGIKKEDIKRLLEQLSKEDLEQARKQLEKSGMSQQQIDQLVQQIKKQQCACQACKQMSQAMSSAAQSAGAGQMGDAMAGLELAGDQLSELEQLEQEMNQLESAMADLQDTKNQMSSQCPHCGGRGCEKCGGSGMSQRRGGGMGRLGQGRGGIAPSTPTDVGFKVHREKVKTAEGAIIGQFLVDGKQVKGEASKEFVEVIAAAERDATETINRDRIPRQFQKVVKEFFERLPAGFGIEADSDPAGAAGTEESEGPDESDGAEASPESG